MKKRTPGPLERIMDIIHESLQIEEGFKAGNEKECISRLAVVHHLLATALGYVEAIEASLGVHRESRLRMRADGINQGCKIVLETATDMMELTEAKLRSLLKFAEETDHELSLSRDVSREAPADTDPRQTSLRLVGEEEGR